MKDLRILSNSRRNGSKFLGVMGDFLRETLDDDRLIEKLAPKYYNYWGRDADRHFGKSAHMILKDFGNQCLIIVKATDAKNFIAEMTFLSPAEGDISLDLLNDLRTLVSNRWSKGKLIAKIVHLKQMNPGLKKSLREAGWKNSCIQGFLEIGLLEKYKRDVF